MTNPKEPRDFETGIEESWTFQEHKEWTANDCVHVANLLTEIAASVREGDFDAFEKFWWQGGTEEGDAKINALREMLVLRYGYRKDHIKAKPASGADSASIKPQRQESQESNEHNDPMIYPDELPRY